MNRAEQKLHARASLQHESLDRMCHEYCWLRQRGGDPARLNKLEQQIRGVDTQLIINRAPAAVAAGIVYGYYREGGDSVKVGSALGLQSACVRQILYKIWKAAKELGFEAEVQNEYKRSRK